MALKYYSFVLLAALTLGNLHLCACRGVEFGQNLQDLSSLLENPAIRSGILQAILHSQGSSPGQIHNILLGSNGNLEELVDSINAELNENILRVDGDAVKVNPEALRNILKRAVKSLIRESLANAPVLAADLENRITEQLDVESPQFDEAVDQSAIPVDKAQQLLVVARKKRSIPLAFDLTDIINNVVLGVLRDQFSSIILGLLENLKEILEANLILVGPGNPVGDFLAGTVNFVIKALLEIITTVMQSLSPQVIAVSETAARVKRDILGDITDIIDNVVPGGDVQNGGLLDGIVRPILTLLATVLGPLNAVIKGVIAGVVSSLEPVLGVIITTRVANVLYAILDLLLPGQPI